MEKGIVYGCNGFFSGLVDKSSNEVPCYIFGFCSFCQKREKLRNQILTEFQTSEICEEICKELYRQSFIETYTPMCIL